MFQKKYFLIIYFISLFNTILNQCNQSNIINRYDCLKYSTSEEFCCFNSTDSTCTPLNKNEIKNNPELDCGVVDNNYGIYELGEYHPKHNLNLPFRTCGEKNPGKKQDCLEYSEITNSCCLFKDGNEKGCYYIGRKYNGELKEKQFSYNGRTIQYECNAFYVNFKFYFIFFLITLFF